jgi:hypothetical protein
MERALDRAISGLWSGMPAETVLIDLLVSIRQEHRGPDTGQKEE